MEEPPVLKWERSGNHTQKHRRFMSWMMLKVYHTASDAASTTLYLRQGAFACIWDDDLWRLSMLTSSQFLFYRLIKTLAAKFLLRGFNHKSLIFSRAFILLLVDFLKRFTSNLRQTLFLKASKSRKPLKYKAFRGFEIIPIHFRGSSLAYLCPKYYPKRQFWTCFSTHYFIYQNFCCRKSCKIACGIVSGGCDATACYNRYAFIFRWSDSGNRYGFRGMPAAMRRQRRSKERFDMRWSAFQT